MSDKFSIKAVFAQVMAGTIPDAYPDHWPEKTKRLAMLCSLLQDIDGGPFPLAGSVASWLNKESAFNGYRRLRFLAAEGVIVEVVEASRRAKRATIWRYLGVRAFPFPTGQISEEGGTR
jgi:hypothetical protein